MIIWIIGGMASGKSTLARSIFFSFFKDGEEAIQNKGQENGVNYIYNYSPCKTIAMIGKCSGAASTGIDSYMTFLRRQGVELSIRKAASECDIVIVEGAQAALTWKETIKSVDENFILFHLKIGFFMNMLRLRKRQATKLAVEEQSVVLTDKNVGSLLDKNKQYRSLFEKLKGETPNIHEFDVENMGEKELFRKSMKIISNCL